MQGTQFAQFSAEVLRRGAAAVLPQHLPDRWLDALLEEADLFAPEAWDPQEDDRVHESCAGLLGAVLVVLMEQRGHPDQLEVAVSTLMSNLHHIPSHFVVKCPVLHNPLEISTGYPFIYQRIKSLVRLWDEGVTRAESSQTDP